LELPSRKWAYTKSLTKECEGAESKNMKISATPQSEITGQTSFKR